MMCNPNPESVPNGSKLNGSSTGNWQPDTSKFLCESFGVLDKSVQEIHLKVLRLREQWLRLRLTECGMPEWMLAGVVARDEGISRLAKHWLALRGISYSTRELNTMQLFRFGELVLDDTLFELPADFKGHYYDPAAESYRATIF